MTGLQQWFQGSPVSIEFRQEAGYDEMHFHPFIQETWMEPTTVLGTRNIKLTHTSHFPSLAVNEAELWVPSPSDDSFIRPSRFPMDWAGEGTPESSVCAGDVNIHRGSLLPALNDIPLFFFVFVLLLSWNCLNPLPLSLPVVLNCFPSKAGCLLEFYKFFSSTKQAQSSWSIASQNVFCRQHHLGIDYKCLDFIPSMPNWTLGAWGRQQDV